jgi:hypothetical protein
MNKIKFVALLILVLLITLAFFSKYISMQNSDNLNLLKTINEQKAFTQEISKNIFYIYKNKNASTEELDKVIRLFIENMNNHDNGLESIESEEIKQETQHIVLLWNEFYFLVQSFRDKKKLENNPYTNIVLEKIVNKIYKKNLKLVLEFNKLIEIHKKYFDAIKERNKFIQIFLFAILITLLIYLFTQLQDLLLFIQKFLQTSKSIVQRSTVRGVEPITLKPKLDVVSKASDDFNFLIQKINKSIDLATESMQNSTQSLEQIENNIEDLLELIDIMDNENSLDKELIKKENIMIEALDEVSSSIQKLQILKKSLENFKK